jgi:hypothetical protein
MEILENRDAWTTNFRAGWLATAEATGKLDWKRYQRPANAQPVSGKAVDLRASRLVLISSAGAYLPASQEPFDAPEPLRRLHDPTHRSARRSAQSPTLMITMIMPPLMRIRMFWCLFVGWMRW